MVFWKGSGSISRRLKHRSRTRVSLAAGWLAIAAAVVFVAPSWARARVRTSIVVDAQTGAVLEAHYPNRRCYPASLTKLMTLYLTFQQLNSGKITLNQMLPVSHHAAGQAPTKLYLRPGSQLSVRSAILAITTRSANDAAVVLAEAIGGTETHFAYLMNQEARRLGMTRTTFRNASGLPNRYQKTTARDLATLALAILHNYPQYYHFFSVPSFVFHGARIYGHDRLLGRCRGVDGMKTGFTDASGFNLVTSAHRDGTRLVAVVMGWPTAYSRDRYMMALINRAFVRIPSRTLASARESGSPRLAASADARKVPDVDPQNEPDSHSEPEWIVQIGGLFHSSWRVRRALESARHSAPDALKGARPLVVKLRRRRYLARFSNLDEATAEETCSLLRRRKFTCSTRPVEPSGVTIAASGR